MRRNIVPWLKLAVCGVVASGHLALLATLMYPPLMLILTAMAAAFMPLGERLERDTEWYTQLTSALSVVALFGIALSAIDLGPIDTVLALMVLVQLHALIHGKRQRHYSYLMLMAFCQAMAASMMSPAPEIALVYLALVTFTVWALVLLDIFRSTEEEGEVLVRGSVNYEARNGELQEAGGKAFRRTMTGWVATLVAASVVVSALLFLTIPRTEAGVFGGEDIFPVQEFVTGVSGEIDVTASGRITEDRTALMNVVFPELPEGRFDGPLYWRVTTFSAYEDGNWTRGQLVSEVPYVLRRAARFAVLPESLRSSAEGVYRLDQLARNTVYYEAFLTQVHAEGMPVLSLPQMVKPNGDDAGRWAWDPSGDMTVRHRNRGEGGISYAGSSVVDGYTPVELMTSKEDYHAVMQQPDFRHLTRHDLLPETVELTERIVEGQESLYGKLHAIERYLSAAPFKYSLEIPPLPQDHPIDAFVRDVQTGHCQLYAASMVLMARSQNIPCRLVSGYRGGLYDSDAQNYTITANMAHVWVEAFLPDYGWIIFDPSPAGDPNQEQAILESVRENYSRILLQLKLFWLREVVGYDTEARTTFLGSLGSDAESPPTTTQEAPEVPVNEFVAPSLFPIVLGVLGLCAFAALGLSMRSAIRRRRSLQGLDADQVRAVRLYRDLLRRLGKAGVSSAGCTAEDLRELISGQFHDQRMPMLAAIEAYNAGRFGGRGLSPERYEQLRRALNARNSS